MQIAAVVTAHGHPEVVADTVASIRAYMTDDVVLVTDGFAVEIFKNLDMMVQWRDGFRHDKVSGNFRNVALGLYDAALKFPNADWYCLLEYDCLVASDSYLEDLRWAGENGIWCLGNDLRDANYRIRIFERIVGQNIDCGLYLLGCCIFLHRVVVESLLKIDFFNRFFMFTAAFANGRFPGYPAYDFGEYMLPTLAHHFGGKVHGLAVWNEVAKKWDGNHQRYPLRWRPELEESSDMAAIYHPLKQFDHPVREYHRRIRNGG